MFVLSCDGHVVQQELLENTYYAKDNRDKLVHSVWKIKTTPSWTDNIVVGSAADTVTDTAHDSITPNAMAVNNVIDE